MIKIGALISGTGTNLKAILESCLNQQIDGKVVFVGSDNDQAKGLDIAHAHKIPTFVIDYESILQRYRQKPNGAELPENFNLQDILKKQNLFHSSGDVDKRKLFLESRVMAEAALLKEMDKRSFDILVLAGFMRVLTPYFIDRINHNPEYPRIINIHPALLPAFPGVDGYGDTYRYGCKVGGCTVHFVDYGEDTGPIIGQRAFQILETDSLEEVKSKGLALEWELYPKCVQMIAEGRVKIITRFSGRKPVSNDARRIVRIETAR
jgi:phosphoribosylglycinamide formyltransferase-1